MATSAFGRAADGVVVIDVWSDVMCPFCYMGDALLAGAVDRFPHDADVDIRYHSYQLRPDLPVDAALDVNEALAESHGMSVAQIEAMNRGVAERGASVGLDYRFDSVIMTNTRRAHRLIHAAKQHGRQHEMVERLFRAYFADGLHVGRYDVLADLAAEVGLDRTAALEALTSGAFEDDVEADIRQARQLGITGVPFFVFDGKYALSGAQPVEAFLQVLDTAWNERVASPVPDAQAWQR